MSDALMIVSLLVSGWVFGLLTAFWWDDRSERKVEAGRLSEAWRACICDELTVHGQPHEHTAHRCCQVCGCWVEVEFGGSR